jgi:hypothetical protein
MTRAIAWAKTLFKGWAASWLFLLWSATCAVIGAALGITIFGTSMISLLHSRGLL